MEDAEKTMKRLHVVPLTLALFLGSGAIASAQGISGDLFFTTYAETPNVRKVSFFYIPGTGLCLTSKTSTSPCPAGPPVVSPVATLTGADGIIFNPNDKSVLLVGEGSANLVASVGAAAGGPAFSQVAASTIRAHLAPVVIVAPP